MPTDVKILQRIAEGSYAASALDYLDDQLTMLVEGTLTAIDELRQAHKLTPEIAFATLHEIGAYRAIRNKLRLKIKQADNTKIAESCEQPHSYGNGDFDYSPGGSH